MPTLAKLFFSLLLKLVNRDSRNVLTLLVLARLSNASHQAAIALGGEFQFDGFAMVIMAASFAYPLNIGYIFCLQMFM